MKTPEQQREGIPAPEQHWAEAMGNGQKQCQNLSNKSKKGQKRGQANSENWVIQKKMQGKTFHGHRESKTTIRCDYKPSIWVLGVPLDFAVSPVLVKSLLRQTDRQDIFTRIWQMNWN